HGRHGERIGGRPSLPRQGGPPGERRDGTPGRREHVLVARRGGALVHGTVESPCAARERRLPHAAPSDHRQPPGARAVHVPDAELPHPRQSPAQRRVSLRGGCQGAADLAVPTLTGGRMQLASRRVYSGRVVRLDVDTVRFPDGSTGELEIIRHPGAAAIVPCLSDPRTSDDPTILLIRQFRYAAGGPLWEVPAGTLDPGEEPEACAHRELLEEAGVTAE